MIEYALLGIVIVVIAAFLLIPRKGNRRGYRSSREKSQFEAEREAEFERERDKAAKRYGYRR